MLNLFRALKIVSHTRRILKSDGIAYEWQTTGVQSFAETPSGLDSSYCLLRIRHLPL